MCVAISETVEGDEWNGGGGRSGWRVGVVLEVSAYIGSIDLEDAGLHTPQTPRQQTLVYINRHKHYFT